MRLLVLGLAVFGSLVLQAAAGVVIDIGEAAVAQPFFSTNAALRALFEMVAFRLDSSADAVEGLYLAFTFLWAGLGEELFYHGYVHGKIRASCGVWWAPLISAVFFALRHGVQLAPLLPQYPWAAAAVWMVVSFLLGLVFSVFCEWARSLYLPILFRHAFNLISLVAAVSTGGA